MNIINFKDLGLAEPLLRSLSAQKFITPTPIQEQAITPVLNGSDLIGIAQTGTGKTAAFALPILNAFTDAQAIAQYKHKKYKPQVKVMILAPTRELVLQIESNFREFAKHMPTKILTVYGGVSRQNQLSKLRRGADIVIGTPGRTLDFLNSRDLKFTDVGCFVLDEADRMLDMGFINDVRKIVAKLPRERQSLMFSATMSPEISKLAKEFLTDPQRIEVSRDEMTPSAIEQHLYHVPQSKKSGLLKELLKNPEISRALVFTRTKHGANRIAEQLTKEKLSTDAIHGNKSQSARQVALKRFRTGKARILVATDLAARGIDVSDISHVINYDLPREPENYVHRIGRTARAGAEGIALSFCDGSERKLLRGIEKLTGNKLSVIGDEPEFMHEEGSRTAHLKAKKKRAKKKKKARRELVKLGNDKDKSPISAKPWAPASTDTEQKPASRRRRNTADAGTDTADPRSASKGRRKAGKGGKNGKPGASFGGYKGGGHSKNNSKAQGNTRNNAARKKG